MAPIPRDVARIEVSELVPLHVQFARELGSVRLRLCEAELTRSTRLYEKALRYQRLVGRLDNRIRVAMLALAETR